MGDAIRNDDDGKQFAVERIPDRLLKEADAVLRREIRIFEVRNGSRASERVSKVVTVLTKEGRNRGVLELAHDRFCRIEKLEGRIYDARGEEVRTLEGSDIRDYSTISEADLFQDARVSTAELYDDHLPYTVRFEYERSFDGYINWPPWYAQESEDPVEYSRFEVLVPVSVQLRYWTNRDSLLPHIQEKDGKRSYVWSAAGLPKMPKFEPEEEIEAVTSVVRIAPGTFRLENYEGDMSSWKSFGSWCSTLASGLRRLPLSAVQDLHSITQTTPGVKERISKVYHYMQARTRYVSIQLGIGGWKPYDASYVHERGYGDCKALSNYMIALLEEAGITAYPALVNRGTAAPPLITAFPSNQFNHMIVCVPVPPDTVWLECTSRSSPPGHLGCDDENRDVLLLLPAGGSIVRTPRSDCLVNRRVRTMRVRLAGNGEGILSSTTMVEGDQGDDVRETLDATSGTDRERWVLNDLKVTGAKILQSSVEGLDANSGRIIVRASLSVPRMAAGSMNRLFFQPNIADRRSYIPPLLSVRLSPVRFIYPYTDIDSVEYSVPGGYKVEALPASSSLENSFGSFASSTTSLGDTALLYVRHLQVRPFSISPSKYDEYRQFFSSVARSDREQVVLVAPSRAR